MQLITETYRQLNSKLHKENKKYGTVGKLYVSDILKLCRSYNTQDVLDYGCGKNTLADNLPFAINKYDPALPEFAELPLPADIVVCTDVAEHIEPELLDNVLSHLRDLTQKVCYITCATVAAVKNLDDGRNAHLTVQNADWWKDRVSLFFTVVNMHVNDVQGVFVMEPKKGNTQ